MGWFGPTKKEKKYKCLADGECCGRYFGPMVPVSELPEKGYIKKQCKTCAGTAGEGVDVERSGFDGGTGASPSGNSW